MQRSLNPDSRPRRGVALLLCGALVAGVLTVAAVVGTSSSPAAAAGLERFASCDELAAWGERASGVVDAPQFEGPATSVVAMDGAGEGRDASFSTVGAPVATAGSAAPESGGDDRASAGTGSDEHLSSGGAEKGTGATNVVVEGVDELDLVDRVDDRRALFTSPSALVLVDLEQGERLSRVALPSGTQVTYDAERSIVWAVGPDGEGMRVEVRRIALDGDRLAEQDVWSTPGSLVTARRVGDLLHLVASDGFAGADVVPFAGGPVPCDQVLHPSGPSDPSATLIATFGSSGDLAPLRATQVVGSGQLVHVTLDAAYLATPQWEAEVSTTLHRFDLDDLAHTGSGRVPGTLLNDFSMSDHDGHLRVAVTAPGGGRVGGGMVIDDFGGDVDIAVDVAGDVSGDGAVTPTMAGREPVAPPATTVAVEPDPGEEEPTEPDPTTTIPETTTTTEAPTTTTEVPETTTTEAPTTTEATTTTASPLDQPGPDDGLNRIYVFDTDGDLDVVGRTPWFGHAGETLHGIRFDGPTAYAVTFLQTDPFYVVDLSDPAAPRIAGELELPGFSGYLHPVGGDLVLGFGPDETGRASAKLFDASDPSAPKLVDTISLGDEAPVVYDHHAFTSLGGGRFATPVSNWGYTAVACPIPGAVPEGADPTEIDEATARSGMDGVACGGAFVTEVVEVEVRGRRLHEAGRTSVELNGTGTRVLPVGDGWAVLADTTVALVDSDGALRAAVDLT